MNYKDSQKLSKIEPFLLFSMFFYRVVVERGCSAQIVEQAIQHYGEETIMVSQCVMPAASTSNFTMWVDVQIITKVILSVIKK